MLSETAFKGKILPTNSTFCKKLIRALKLLCHITLTQAARIFSSFVCWNVVRWTFLWFYIPLGFQCSETQLRIIYPQWSQIFSECVLDTKLLIVICLYCLFFCGSIVEIKLSEEWGCLLRAKALAAIAWLFRAMQVMKKTKQKNLQPIYICGIPVAETLLCLINHRKIPSRNWTVGTEKLRSGFTGTQILRRWPSDIRVRKATPLSV